MSGSIPIDKQIAFRNRSKPVKKWTRSEEIALIKYLKQNRDFEKPISRIYYNTFLAENGINCDFKTVRSKVRNMRSSYRRAKEYEINKLKSNDMDIDIETVRREMIKICWFLDDFDDIFPNEMDSYIDKNQPIPEFEDDFSNQEEHFSNTQISTKNTTINDINKNQPIPEFEDDLSNQGEYFSNTHITTKSTTVNDNFNIESESSTSSSSKSMEEGIFTVKKDMFNLKRRKHSKDNDFRRQELELYKDRLNFEKEKFHREIRLKEREIESQERLKIMELQMKERIAMKELELKEKLALKSMEKQESLYNNSYHNIT